MLDVGPCGIALSAARPELHFGEPAFARDAMLHALATDAVAVRARRLISSRCDQRAALLEPGIEVRTLAQGAALAFAKAPSSTAGKHTQQDQ